MAFPVRYLLFSPQSKSKRGEVFNTSLANTLMSNAPTLFEEEPADRKVTSSDDAEASVIIEQNDCISFLDSLEENSVDVITTDPAYSGMNQHLQLGEGRIVGEYAKAGEDGRWFEEFRDTEENYERFLTACKRVLNDQGHLYIMFDSYSLLSLGDLVRKHFDVKNIIVWDKVNWGMGHYYRRRHEFVLFATNGNTRKLRNQSFPDVWRFKRIYNAPYSTQKPVELFQTMIYASAETGYTVCDPFLGSGSAAIATIENNCHFIGCDIAKEAIKLAKERVDKYQHTGKDSLQPKSASIKGEKVFWKET